MLIPKHKKQTGFTIVELLIVIVIIGILAAITVVAYNGIQDKAKNVKTTQALDAWVKGLTLYKTDNGHWPHGWVCLGAGYSYGISGNDASGTAQCRQTGSGGYVESTSFNDEMKPYFGSSLPTPAFITAKQDDNNWRRGLMYAYGGGGDGTEVYINAAYAGQISSCPSAGGIPGNRSQWGDNTFCSYTVGRTSDT